MNKKSLVLFVAFLFLILSNFIAGMLVAHYGIKLFDFIALEFFDIEMFYWDKSVFTRYAMYLYFESLLDFSIWLVPLYSILCYWLYNKYQGLKYFLIIFAVFIAYFFLLCFFVIWIYKLNTFLMHFSAFCLMYIEIILLYRIKNKYKARE